MRSYRHAKHSYLKEVCCLSRCRHRQSVHDEHRPTFLGIVRALQVGSALLNHLQDTCPDSIGKVVPAFDDDTKVRMS